MDMRQHKKLFKACLNLGLTMTDALKLIVVSDEVKVAAWGYDKRTGEEHIYINPRIVKKHSPSHIQLILEHEILHYAGYKGNSHYKNQELLNVALDALINKILYITYQTRMLTWSRKIYSEESKRDPVAVARCDIRSEEIPDEKIRKVWAEIWQESETKIPSLASVYYGLLSSDSIKQLAGRGNPFASGETATIIFRKLPKELSEKGEVQGQRESKMGSLAESVLDKVIRTAQYKLRDGSGFSNSLSDLFTTLQVEKEEFDVDEVAEFIKRMSIREKLDCVAGSIIDVLNGKSHAQIYPYQLSRLGLIYVALGISNFTHLYWNKVPDSRKNKLAIYIDTSPSMDIFKEMEAYLVDQLIGFFPSKIFVFAGNVKEISTEKFAKGEYEAGYSTNFDAVVEHLVNSEFDTGVIFTDGESSVSLGNQKKFKGSKKRLFTVYFTRNGSKVKSDLDNISESRFVIRKK